MWDGNFKVKGTDIERRERRDANRPRDRRILKIDD